MQKIITRVCYIYYKSSLYLYYYKLRSKDGLSSSHRAFNSTVESKPNRQKDWFTLLFAHTLPWHPRRATNRCVEDRHSSTSFEVLSPELQLNKFRDRWRRVRCAIRTLKNANVIEKKKFFHSNRWKFCRGNSCVRKIPS